jgi:hypothetical protein
MLKLAFCLFITSSVVFGQVEPQVEKININKDVASIQAAVNEVVNSTIPGLVVLQAAKGAYLDGYGVVVSVEVALEAPRNPFNALTTSNNVRATVGQRQKDMMDKLATLLKQKVPVLDLVGPAESVAIIVNLLNTNPADLPDMPSQIVLSVKKQEAAAARISIREYK